ncbi:MAG: hypothetical protein HQL21_02870 [Candidatus Omnitrophica bacterium]|nr:hypothetical protein [Candidatus Omnitrophota bacterium]
MTDFFIVLYWGIFDSANLCQMASSGLMVLAGFLFWRDDRAFFSFAGAFVSAYSTLMFFLHSGLIHGFLGTTTYNVMVVVFYVITGVVFLVFGGILFFSWCSVRRGLKEFVLQGVLVFPGFCYRPLGVVLACLAAVHAAFWPLSIGALMNTQTMFIPGFLFRGTISLLFYEFLQLWPILGLIAGYVLFHRNEKFRCFMRGRRPALCVISSVVYMVLGGSLVVFFLKGWHLQ